VASASTREDRMRSAGFGLIFAAAVGLASASLAPAAAYAEEPQSPAAVPTAEQQSSFTALVAKGFEVKSVVLVPLEVAKRVTDTVKTDNVIVTLQNKESVAVCYVAFANWAFMNKTSLDTTTLCEVR